VDIVRSLAALHSYFPENQRKRSLTAMNFITMNDTFDLRRFGWYARKEFRENWKAYALFPLVILVIQLGAIYQLCGPLRDYVYYEQLTSGYMLLPYPSLILSAGIALWLAGSFSFRYLATPQQSLPALTLPVSAFERFCFAWVIAIPISLLLVYSLWYFSWSIATPIIKVLYPKAYVEYHKYHSLGIYQSVFVFVYSAAFMLGAVVLGRLSFVKTIGIAVGIFTLLYIFQKIVLHAVLHDANEVVFSPYPGPTFLSFRTASKELIQPISTFETPYEIWWYYCLPVALWGITYLKLKEKEI
jgi:hypothetical protein